MSVRSFSNGAGPTGGNSGPVPLGDVNGVPGVWDGVTAQAIGSISK
jgi:hypothetical protein